MEKVWVFVATSEPTPVPTPGVELYRFRVMGWSKVAPGVVMQLLRFQLPFSQPQLESSTVTVSSRRAPGASCTRSPNSREDVASKPTLATAVGVTAPMES